MTRTSQHLLKRCYHLLLPAFPPKTILKQGGSITPEAAGLLAELQQGQPAGVLHVCEEVQVVDASWDWEQQQWDIWLQVGAACGNVHVSLLVCACMHTVMRCGKHLQVPLCVTS